MPTALAEPKARERARLSASTRILHAKPQAAAAIRRGHCKTIEDIVRRTNPEWIALGCDLDDIIAINESLAPFGRRIDDTAGPR